VSRIFEEEEPRTPSLEEQVRAASPSVPFLPVLPPEVSRRPGPPEHPVPLPARSEVAPGEIPEPGTYGHIRSLTPPSEEAPGELPRDAPAPEVSRVPTQPVPPSIPRSAPVPGEIPEPESYGHIRDRSVTPPSEEAPGEVPRDVPGYPIAPGPPVPRAPTRAPTTRGVPDFTRAPSGPGRLDYDDAERDRHERFGEIERQLADATQGASEAEMRREHDFQEKEAERERQFAEAQVERIRQFEDERARTEDLLSALSRQPVPPGAPGAPPVPLPSDVLEVPERAESVIASIRRASAESAARHADDIRDIVQGEREEMMRQLQAEREDARAAREQLEQQVLAERKRADDECDARVRELEEELARVRNELDRERQQRDHDEEMRREDESHRNLERDDEMRKQLSEITDLLLAHREEFARKKETVDERWREKMEWRDETNRQFQDLFGMVQTIINNNAEDRQRCEDERRAEAERPCKRNFASHSSSCVHLFSATQDIMEELQRLREFFESLTNGGCPFEYGTTQCLIRSTAWRDDTDRKQADLLEAVRSTANVQVPFNVQGVSVLLCHL